MLPAACLVISFFPSTAPYLLLWQLNATRGANEIPSHIEIQITHQLDEQANVEYIGTAISKCDRLGNGSTRGGLVRCIGDKLSSVGQANRTEQIEGGGGDKEDVQFVEGSPGKRRRERR